MTVGPKQESYTILRQFSSRNHAMDILISSGGEGGKIRQRADADFLRIFSLSPPEETQLVYLQLKKKFESWKELGPSGNRTRACRVTVQRGDH